MIFARFITLLLLASFGGFALGADKTSSAGSNQATYSSNIAPSRPAAARLQSNGAATQPFWLPRIEPIVATLRPNGPSRIPPPRLRGRSLADLNGNVCYFMRTYKIKPTERVKEGESVSRDYSECQMASNYDIRSAVAHEQGAATLK